jgi:hypothetical protein
MGETPPSSPPPPSEDRDNTSSSSRDKNRKKLLQTAVTFITIIVAIILFAFVAFVLFDIKDKMTITIVDGVIDTPANYYTYYTFSVPAGASIARVTGNYEVHGGLIPRIDIYLADTSLCSSPIDCSSYYYVGKDKSFGKVNLSLPTSARSRQTTYYLSFHNIGPLGESNQTEASFKLEVS